MAMQVGIWTVWLNGLVLVVLSLCATRMLPPPLASHTRDTKFGRRSLSSADHPKITIFTAPGPFNGAVGHGRTLALRSWLALSSRTEVVLFTQDPRFISLSRAYGPRVVIDPNIDFTFLGTPFFHSMLARSQSYKSDISILIDPEIVVLPDFVPALYHAYKLENDWLLVASSQIVSNFSFHLDGKGNWIHVNGKRTHVRELRARMKQNSESDSCEKKTLLAWNNVDVPLHCGVLPPFLYGKGIHNEWVINEALSCKLRFVFDATWAVTSFFLNYTDGDSKRSVIEDKSWEYVGNSHLGLLYGSLFFHSIGFSILPRLLRCKKQYVLVNVSEDAIHPLVYHRDTGSWTEIFGHSWGLMKVMACVDRIKSPKTASDCPMKDQQDRLPQLDLPFSLESLLPLIADENKTIVLGVAGYGYKDMLMSWICRLRSLRVRNFMVCALDQETYHFSILQGLPVFVDPTAPRNISLNDCHFGTECFQRVTKVKSRLVLRILKLGYNVMLSDVDVYWFKNPLPYLWSFGPAVLAAQSDEYNKTVPINLPRRLNSGFYFARSDNATIAAMEKVVKHAAFSGLSEQPSFYDTLCGEGGSQRVGFNRCMEPETNLTVHFLDRDLFPNGAYSDLWLEKDVKGACAKKSSFVIHNNWINGRLRKLERQVKSGLWEYDSSTRMCLRQSEA